MSELRKYLQAKHICKKIFQSFIKACKLDFEQHKYDDIKDNIFNKKIMGFRDEEKEIMLSIDNILTNKESRMAQIYQEQYKKRDLIQKELKNIVRENLKNFNMKMQYLLEG